MSDSSYLSSLDLSAYDISDHSSESKNLTAVSIICPVVVGIVAILRASSVKFFMRRSFQYTDYHLFCAAVLAITLNFGCIYGANNGVGQHIWDLLYAYQNRFLEQAEFVTGILYGIYAFYNLSVMFTKLSIICSYRSFFPHHAHPKFRIFTIVMMTIVILMAVASFFTLLLECVPVESSWNWSIERHSCIDIQLFFNLTSAINLAVDVILLAAPMPLFMMINNTLEKRLMLCALYCVGLLACVASGLRLMYLQGLQSSDATYSVARGLIWSEIEPAVGIVCACTPSLKPLAEYIWEEISHTFLRSIANIMWSYLAMKDRIRRARENWQTWGDVTFWPRMVRKVKFSPNRALRRVGTSVLGMAGHNPGGTQSDWESGFEMTNMESRTDMQSTHESQKQDTAEMV